jgi:outer membrane protein assembly factor BamB
MLLYRNHLYNFDWNGAVKCMDPLTGKELWAGKLGKAESFVASPVASDGKIYTVSERGTVFIIKDGNAFEQVAEIPMNDVSLVAPAVTDGMIFFRSQKYLFAVGGK